MTGYEPRVRRVGSYAVYCVHCYREIKEGETYHYIVTRHSGTRPYCMECARELGLDKEYRDDKS